MSTLYLQIPDLKAGFLYIQLFHKRIQERGGKFRSKAEQYIADWLYRHSIPYEYEPLFKCKRF